MKEVAWVSLWELNTGSVAFFVHLKHWILELPVPIFYKGSQRTLRLYVVQTHPEAWPFRT